MFWKTGIFPPSEVAQLDSDPYCFLIPAEGEMPALFSGAPAVPTGTLNTTEAKDIAAFNATFAVTGTLATTEAQDVAAFNATYAVTGTLNTTEAQDVAAFNATFAITGTLNTTEAKDTAAFNATFAITGTLATTEGQDIAAFTGIRRHGIRARWPRSRRRTRPPSPATSWFRHAGDHRGEGHSSFTGSFIVVTGTLATTEARTPQPSRAPSPALRSGCWQRRKRRISSLLVVLLSRPPVRGTLRPQRHKILCILSAPAWCHWTRWEC